MAEQAAHLNTMHIEYTRHETSVNHWKLSNPTAPNWQLPRWERKRLLSAQNTEEICNRGFVSLGWNGKHWPLVETQHLVKGTVWVGKHLSEWVFALVQFLRLSLKSHSIHSPPRRQPEQAVHIHPPNSINMQRQQLISHQSTSCHYLEE